MQVTLYLDEEGFTNKPKKASPISARIAKSVVQVELEDLATQLVLPNGRSFVPAHFGQDENGTYRRTNEAWAGQQVFALDLDKGITLDELLQRCEEYRVHPAFIYSTFSSTHNDKFRAIFVTPMEITDFRMWKVTQTALMTLFPECDRACKDPARLFYGGKEILYSRFDARIQVPDLIESLCFYLSDTVRRSNYKRSIERFCGAVGLASMNGLPKILPESDLEVEGDLKTDVLSSNPIIYKYRTCDENIRSYYFYFVPGATDEDSRSKRGKYKTYNENRKRELIRGCDFDRLACLCRLFREFISGEHWAYHNQIFGLATNLLNIEGGRAKLVKGLKSRDEYAPKIKKWEFSADYIRDKNYYGQRCDRYCPFADECEHAVNIIKQGQLKRGEVKVLEPPEYLPLQEVEEKMRMELKRALAEDGNKIYVIKAQTGLGKTELCLNLKNVTIACPTHKLKEEIVARMRTAGNECISTPALPSTLDPSVKKHIDRLYDVGAYSAAGMYIKRIAEEEDIPELIQYLKDLETVKTARKTVITTHERLLYLDNNNQTIIIDEDITPTLLKQGSVRIKDLAALHVMMYNTEAEGVLASILDMVCKTGVGLIAEMPGFVIPNGRELEKRVAQSDDIESNVLSFLNCSHFMKVKDDELVFINRRNLPLDKKIIVLSATTNEQIYKLLFGDRVEFIDVGEAEHTGKIIQYPKYSFSRYRINEKPELLDSVRDKVGNMPVITFKSLEHEFENVIATFGATEGLDGFGGRDIAVVGTPHVAPHVYLLYAAAMGLRPGLNDNKTTYTVVRRNGYEYYFNCLSDDPVIREIQSWIIESELTQAIGRARTLRNDCTVTVFSNMPIRGAEFRYD